MKTKLSPATVGMFVLGAMLLAVVGFLLLVFSFTHFNQKKHVFIICK